LLAVASDLLASAAHWRIEVFDAAGKQIISYNSDELAASDLGTLQKQREWSPVPVSGHAEHAHAG
jgi:hypothetical protein